jgi:transposase
MKKGQGYSGEFRQSIVRQSIVNLYKNGKSSPEIMSEYGISPSAFYKWVKKYSVVQISENESLTMTEIKAMQKRLALLEEENLI